ncbi:MAG TPA: hypothetical protein VFE16_06120 [Candidatus Cybelea sp.]|jgi:hypothetical protein|nr:hypothetical protein [Candidatus Cybelea sp.]
MKRIVLSLALGVALQGAALAQSPSPVPSAASVQFTAHDVATLLKATMDAVKSPDITINVVVKDAAAMPAYDPIFHFAGLNAKGAATIWVLTPVQKTEASANALRAATELACMATGFAGAFWKAIYSQVAAADAAQPADSPNPYKYRLALTARIQAIIDGFEPSPSPTPQ